MKRILKITLLFFATTLFASNTEIINKLDKQSTSVLDKSSNGIEKVYGDGTNAISVVYGDLKSLAPKVESTIKQLAKGLKVGAESVWSILVKQQKVWSWCYLIGTILAALSWVNFYYRFNKGSLYAYDNNNEWADSDTVICWLTCLISLGLSGLSIYNFESMMTGFINPEFGAMRNIITIASQLK